MENQFDNIFTFEFEVTIMPGVTFKARSTFLELRNNELLIISPGPFDESYIKGVVAKYNKVYCLAPNAFHNLYLEQFNKLFPKIEIYGPQIIEKKRPGLKGLIIKNEILAEHLSGQVSFYPIKGNDLLSETVLYCHQSQSIIVTDLIFNMKKPMPLGRKVLLALVGAYDRPAQSRLIKASIKNKNSYFQSIEFLRDLKCKNLIMAHGEIIHDSQEIEKTIQTLIVKRGE